MEIIEIRNKKKEGIRMAVSLVSKDYRSAGKRYEHSWTGHDTTPLRFDVVEKPVFSEGVEVPDKKAIFRADENKLDYISTVSKRYPVIRHADIIDKIEQGMDLLTKDTSIKTIVSYNGARMQRIYTINSYRVEVKPNDEISPSIRIVNSYDGTLAVGFFIDAVRIVCTNGLISTRQFMSMSYRHFGSKFNVNTFAENAKKLIAGFKEYSENWRSWTKEYVSDERAELLLNFMPARFRPAIRSRFDNNFDGTKWGLYAAFTEAITHDYIPIKSRTPDTQKINLGHDVTKMFATNWYWTVDVDDLRNIVKKSENKSLISNYADNIDDLSD